MKSPVLCLASIAALGSTPVSAAVVSLFRDEFTRGNNANLNAAATGKSGTLGALNWIEEDVAGSGFDAEIVSNRMVMNGETASNLTTIPYVDQNFIGSTGITTSFTVGFDFISSVVTGSTRFLGFSIGNTVAEISARTTVAPFGDVSISYDHTNVQASVPNDRRIYIHHGGTLVTSFLHTLDANDRLSATFTFASFGSGAAISYQVYDNATLIYTSAPGATWSGTNENFISLFNTHGAAGGDTIIDNFEVSIIPEPCAALLGSLGMIALLRRRR
jgi:hypothetical protein